MEQIVYAPDPKQELLQSCLKSSVGDYQPVQVDVVGSSPTRGGGGSPGIVGPKPNRPFVPGIFFRAFF